MKACYTIQLNEGLRMRKFKITRKDNGLAKNIVQVHLTCWADHTIPDAPYYKIIDIISLVDDFKEKSQHCSAGIGRTGTFISIYNLYHEINEQINKKKFNQIHFFFYEFS